MSDHPEERGSPVLGRVGWNRKNIRKSLARKIYT